MWVLLEGTFVTIFGTIDVTIISPFVVSTLTVGSWSRTGCILTPYFPFSFLPSAPRYLCTET